MSGPGDFGAGAAGGGSGGGGAGKTVLIVVIVVLVLGAVCCGGAMFLGKWGMDQVGELAAAQLRTDERVVDAVGEIESISMAMMKTAHVQQNDPVYKGQEVIVFDVEGQRASGELITRESKDPNSPFEPIELRLEDGTVISFED